jgi:type II secretory pathway pseudopilin PulG
MAGSHRHIGFALMMTLVLIGMVAITLASLGMTTYLQIQRTQLETQQAQLRQLLLAGEQAARARLSTSAPIDGAMTLPDSLTSDEAALTLRSENVGQDQATVYIDATLGRRQMSQTVHFIRQGEVWRLDSAELGT